MSSTKGKSKTKAALNLVELLEVSNRKIKGYSKGMRQRLKVAQALAHEPDILILDEPLTGTDPIAKFTVNRVSYQGVRMQIRNRNLKFLSLLFWMFILKCQ